MSYQAATFLFVIGLFVGMVLLLEVGRRIGLHRKGKDPEGARAGLGAVEGAIFGCWWTFGTG